jgi:hypothetical protein
VQTAGEIALEAARQAAERFRAVKFDLQRRVVSAYLDLALVSDALRHRIEEELGWPCMVPDYGQRLELA